MLFKVKTLLGINKISVEGKAKPPKGFFSQSDKENSFIILIHENDLK
jgi:hypothetical protein